MKRRVRYLIFAVALLGMLSISLSAGQKNYKIIGQEEEFYFGHITYLETPEAGASPMIIRGGQEAPEEAVLNAPIMPGDVILSNEGRVELQFDNGTIVRLDKNTEIKVETILAPSLSSMKKLSNLVLSKGKAYVMYKRYDSFELFQVITPETAVKLDHHAVALVQSVEDGRTELVVRNKKAYLMTASGGPRNPLEETVVEKGRKAVVESTGQVQVSEYSETDDFLTWNEAVNANFDLYHEGSVLPQPLQNLPPAVFYFAQRYGSVYGEWVWHELYGYVWRPFYNDYYPWGTWQPFYHGRWSYINGSLFWIPEEPWGWVPYHLGLWVWDKNKGWVWIPGSLFAPAWAVWDFYFGFYAWRPWSLYDWYLGTTFGPYGYNYSLGSYYSYFYLPPGSDVSPREVLNKVRKDQLKRSAASQKVPVPKELKKITDIVLRNLNKGNSEAIEMLHRSVTNMLLVKKDEVSPNLPKEKILPFKEAVGRGEIALSPVPGALRRERMTLPKSFLNPGGKLDAPAKMIRNEGVSEAREFSPRSGLSDVSPAEKKLSFSEARVRVADWNPDFRLASRLGVQITYDSQRNEVRCPQLNLGSRDSGVLRGWGPGPMGSFASPANPFASGGMTGPTSSSFAGGAARASSGASGRENSGGGRSGEKK